MIERKWKGFNLQERDWNWYRISIEEVFYPNADRYFYRVNGVEYYYDSAKFKEIMAQFKTWQVLNDSSKQKR